MSLKPESKFWHKVKKDLEKIDGCYAFKTQEVGRRGIPDVLGCLNGRFFALELKVGKNKASALQELELRKIGESGAYAAIVYPDGWNQVLMEILVHCGVATQAAVDELAADKDKAH